MSHAQFVDGWTNLRGKALMLNVPGVTEDNTVEREAAEALMMNVFCDDVSVEEKDRTYDFGDFMTVAFFCSSDGMKETWENVHELRKSMGVESALDEMTAAQLTLFLTECVMTQLVSFTFAMGGPPTQSLEDWVTQQAAAQAACDAKVATLAGKVCPGDDASKWPDVLNAMLKQSNESTFNMESMNGWRSVFLMGEKESLWVYDEPEPVEPTDD